MKVTVKDNFLNVRIGRPSVNAECHQFLAPGSVIDVDGKLYPGDRFHGIDTWYKDAAGNYYWSGGVGSGDVKFNYNTLLGLPDPICATKGDGVVVAIIDSGCYDHRSLTGSIIASYDVFLKKEDVRKDESLNGHGTFISGIIGAREGVDSEIVGVAPLVKLVTVKAVVDDEVFAENVLAALQWILQLGKDRQPNIINLSLDFDPGGLIDDIEKALKACTEKGMVIVAAGQNEQEVYRSGIFYPAWSMFVSGVGALSKVNVSADRLNDAIDFVVPNLSLYSTTNFNNKYRNLEGCSISAALVSGVFALFFSFKAKSPGNGSLSAVINQHIGTFDPGSFDNTLKIFKK